MGMYQEKQLKVNYILNAWRATQYGQNEINQSVVDILKRNQRAGDCNRLIASIENVLETAYQVKNVTEAISRRDITSVRDAKTSETEKVDATSYVGVWKRSTDDAVIVCSLISTR